jgi:hypothetical protein
MRVAFGGIIAGTYKALSVYADWSLRTKHVWRAAGSITAFAIIGLMAG